MGVVSIGDFSHNVVLLAQVNFSQTTKLHDQPVFEKFATTYYIKLQEKPLHFLLINLHEKT